MRARERHGRGRGPVQRPVGLHQEQARLGEERRLLDSRRGYAAARGNVKAPLPRLVDRYAVADGEVRQAPVRFGLLGALFRVGAGDDGRDAALVELADHAVQLARGLAAHRAVQPAVYHDHGEGLGLLRRERPVAAADGVEFKRGYGLTGFQCHGIFLVVVAIDQPRWSCGRSVIARTMRSGVKPSSSFGSAALRWIQNVFRPADAAPAASHALDETKPNSGLRTPSFSGPML